MEAWNVHTDDKGHLNEGLGTWILDYVLAQRSRGRMAPGQELEETQHADAGGGGSSSVPQTSVESLVLWPAPRGRQWSARRPMGLRLEERLCVCVRVHRPQEESG